MRIDGIALASGEEIVRRYSCTVTDRVIELAGSVLPLPRREDGEGTVTLTDRRLIFDMDAGTRRDGSPRGSVHQEVLLSDISSVSTSISRVRRGTLLPLALIVLGLILMTVPCAIAAASGEFDADGDYQDGFNDGIETGYYEGFLSVVQQPSILHEATIPEGYRCEGRQADASAEYDRGFEEGYSMTRDSGVYDATMGKTFSVPYGLMTHNDPWPGILAAAAAGFVLIVSGSLVYSVSGITCEWAAVRLGSPGRGVYLTSVAGGWSSSSVRGIRPSGGYEEMVRDLGAAIMDTRGRVGRTTALRVEEDDVEEPGVRMFSMVDRGEDGGVDEEVPDIYGRTTALRVEEDDGIVLGREEVP